MVSHKFLYVILIFIILFLEACGTATIKMETTPELKVGSPLSGIQPITFLIKSFRDEVGEVVSVSGVGVVKIDKSANQLFSQAITAELRRNGHTVLLHENDGKADIIIDGVVKKYLIEFRHSSWSTKAFSNAEVEMTLKKSADATEGVSKLYKSSYECDGALNNPHLFEDRWRNCLHEALLDIVKDFSTDPDLLDMLKKVEKL